MGSKSGLRHRKPQNDEQQPLLEVDTNGKDSKPTSNAAVSAPAATESRAFGNLLLWVATLASFVTRFYAISFPSQVVFDEVHFGKFASYYLRRTFYFDVHPPLGRLLIAAAGWVIGYDGHFDFTNIGDDYIENKVPYIELRAWPALCGALVVPLVFEILRELRFSLQACFLAAMLVVLDNSLVAQSRLILLDSMLMLFMTLALYCWVKFSKQRHNAFSCAWWSWLAMTGISLGLVMGVKMVGLFTVATIGIAVLVELWYLLDYRRTSMAQFANHFFARALCLIAVPVALYLTWFYIHFAVLTKTGPGDAFMSPNFQATLIGNKMSGRAELVVYGANVTLKHFDTGAFLHSHKDRYPLTYEDKRVSSQGQQVTGYPHNDTNNVWLVKPADPDQWATLLDAETPHAVVKHNSIVVLEHLNTKTHLLTHDVASPHTTTNQEFTTIPEEDWLKRLDETLFRVEIDGAADDEEPLKTLGVQFRLVHVKTGVAMHTFKKPLPSWAYGQQEINGNKKKDEKSNKWLVEEVVYPTKSEPVPIDTAGEGLKKPSFLKKFFELQGLMISHNAGLTKPHPYQSPPQNWPLVLTGISFWQDSVDKQIYLLPNPVAWWVTLGLIGVYAMGWVFERIAERRGVPVNDPKTANQVHFSIGFLFIAWALHYFPFYLMGRSLFLHHYLPAAIIAFMVAGAMFDYVLTTMLPSLRKSATANIIAWVFTAACVAGIAAVFWYYAPLTYGTTGLTVDELKARKWLQTWNFQYSG
ncbi:hypothetical protein GGF31_005822 [Allomyces arbusculus]|nr:hypothetical protein GGF31_005822 [Allomyces arbusculus]